MKSPIRPLEPPPHQWPALKAGYQLIDLRHLSEILSTQPRRKLLALMSCSSQFHPGVSHAHVRLRDKSLARNEIRVVKWEVGGK